MHGLLGLVVEPQEWRDFLHGDSVLSNKLMKIVPALLTVDAFERVRDAKEKMLVGNGADKLQAEG
jgi:hypothetical protein